MWISDEIEYWPDSASRFTQISALYSELVAVSSTGQIFQWRWNDLEPYKHPDVSFCNHLSTTFVIIFCTDRILISIIQNLFHWVYWEKKFNIYQHV